MFSVAVLLLLLAAGPGVNCEQLTQPESLTIQPGQPLTIRCQVSYSVSSYYTAWIRQPEGHALEWIGRIRTDGKKVKDSLSSKFSLAVDGSSNTVTLQGQNMQPGDSAVYYCARVGVGGFDYWGKGTVVTVSDSAVQDPIPPKVFPLVQCGSGTEEVTIGCMATGFTPASLTFKWEFGGGELAGAVQYPTSKRENQYTVVSQIRVRRQDWDNRKPFTCSAEHAGGTAIKADVLKQVVVYKLPALSILISETESSQKVSFGCFAADFSPKDYTITWLRNGKKIDPSESRTSSEGKKNETGLFYTAASYIQVEENRWKDDGTNITCRFANSEAHVDASLTYGSGPGCEASTKLEIDILPISLETMYLENNAELVCKVHSSDPVEVKWFNESGEVLSKLEKSSSNRPTYIATAKITYDEWSKGMNWYCRAGIKDSIEEPTRKYFSKNNGPNRVPPSVYLLPPVDDLSCTNMTLTCFVKDFYPEDVLVHWLVDKKPIDGNALYSHKTTNVIENGGLFSTYGQLTFKSDSWKDGRVFRCEVYHMSMDSKNQPIVKLISEKSSGNVNIINMNMCPSTCLPQ
nr:immunoglobulin heavy chain constant region [Melanogrammus aeglefinus]